MLQRLHPILLVLIILLLTFSRAYWIDTPTEYTLAIIGIFITGIPHGAMDHHTASFLDGTRFRLFRYLLQYLLASFAYLLIWYFMPGFAFVLFLILTAWHFGETDIQSIANNRYPGLIVFTYGFSLTMWLLLKDSTTILYWTGILTDHHKWVKLLIKFLLHFPHVGWFVIASSILLFTIRTQSEKWLHAALFLLFVLIAPSTSLLIGFMVYFSGWHSLKALTHLRISVFNIGGIRQMFWGALPAIAGAFILFASIFYLGNREWVNHKGLPALFILLAVLTLPHMIQMHRLYQFFSSKKE